MLHIEPNPSQNQHRQRKGDGEGAEEALHNKGGTLMRMENHSLFLTMLF